MDPPATQEDTKDPFIKGEETIQVKVRRQVGSDIVLFKIKRNMPLKKMMDTYCDRQGLDRKSIRFLFDGTRITENDTPHTLDMENEDVIDAVLEQHGGYFLKDNK